MPPTPARAAAEIRRVRPPLRRIVLGLHLWLALGLGLLVSVVCVSGSISQFRGDLERWAVAGPATATASGRADRDRVAADLERRCPGMRAVQCRAGAGPGDADAWTLRTPGHQGHGGPSCTIYTDPGSGAVLGSTEGSAVAGFLQSAYLFHHMLWIRTWGRWVVGLSGLALAVLAGTGAWLAWPALAAWRRGGWTRGWSGLWARHARLGLLLTPILLATAITGFLNGFVAFWRPPLLAASAGPSPVAVPPPPAGTPVGWTLAIAQSALALPGTALHAVQRPPPGEPRAPWMVVRLWPGDLSPRDGAVVSIDADAGTVRSVQDPRTLDGARRLLFQQLGFHVGWFGGLAGRIAWCLAGLAPPLLLASGIVLWRHRRRVASGSVGG